MLILSHQFAVRLLLALLVASHTLLVEYSLAALADLGNSLHGIECLGHQVAVVADRHVAARSEGESAVDDHFFAGGLAEGFGPLQLAGVTLHFEL